MLASSGPSAAPLLVEAGLVAAVGLALLARHALTRAIAAVAARGRRSGRIAARRQVGRA
jgi:hypothetical protein